MTIETLKEDYDLFTGKLSELARSLNFAGIAVIWILRIGTEDSGIVFSPVLLWPLGLFVFSLTLDFLHYAYASIAWGIFYRLQDTKEHTPREIRAPRWINWPTLVFFWAKCAFCASGFIVLLKYIAAQIVHS
ncbi:MAG: hypothetical protein IT577_05380 [Verrucomicrobiae bacterium]|jgi:hypothetical protein|nr:hypothetical protein [Verrucomicrobiae bacterium]